MRKLNYLIGLTLIVGLMSSCKKDDATIPAPSVTFQNGMTTMAYTGTNFIDINVTFAAEGKIESVALNGPSLTGTGTTTTTITNKMGTTASDNANGETSATYLFKVSAIELAAAFINHSILSYTFTVTDKQNSSTTGTFTVTAGSGNPVAIYNDIQLGSYNNTTIGSSFASLDGTVYELVAAKANSSKIDVIFFYGATNNATLSAPSNLTDLNVLFTTGSAPSTWTVLNDTKLLKRNDIDFASVTNGNDIPNVQSTGSVKVNNLSVGDVVAFRTASTNTAFPNKNGIIKVTAITGSGATAVLKFNVKVAS